MNKWLSIGVTPEPIYREWESAEAMQKRVEASEANRDRVEQIAAYQRDANARRVEDYYRRLPDEFTTANACDRLGLGIKHTRRLLKQFVVAGRLRNYRVKKFNVFKKVQ